MCFNKSDLKLVKKAQKTPTKQIVNVPNQTKQDQFFKFLVNFYLMQIFKFFIEYITYGNSFTTVVGL